MQARLNGSCVECGERIRVGQEITGAVDGGWQHEDCGPNRLNEIGWPRPVCGKCFMTICDCGKD